MARINGYCIYPHVKDHSFILQKARNFTSTGELSSLNLVVDDIKDDSGFSLAIPLDRLIHIDLELFSEPEKRPDAMKDHFERLITLLKKCRGTNLQTEKITRPKRILEKDVVYTLAKKILIPLFGSIDFEKGYGSYVSDLQGAEVKSLGIGSLDTWHGESEIRIEKCDALLTLDPLSEELASNEDEQDRASNDELTIGISSTALDGKIKISERKNIGQLVGTCVVNSFTEKNCEEKENRTLNTPIPTILFNKTAFIICFYDAKNDVMLLSEPRNLLNQDGGISRTAVLLLWITVYHR